MQNITEDIMEDEEVNVFQDLQYDFKSAKNAKTTIDTLITDWNDLYYGVHRDHRGDIMNGDSSKSISHTQNKSKTVMKEIAKQIEWQKPNITEPFISTRHPIRLSCNKSEERARMLEKWTNNEFTNEFDREEFISQATDILLREGTVWTQTSWVNEEENNRIVIPNASLEKIMENPIEPTEIEQNSDGTFNVEYNEIVTSKNNPDTIVLRNEHVFPDPSARKDSELRFVAVVKLMTISDLKKIDFLDKEKIDLLSDKVNGENEDTNLGNIRDADARDYGFDSGFQPKDTARRQLRIVEYWGYYDLDNDGIAEPIVAYWSEKHKINLGIEENPMPDNLLPFNRTVYSARPFSLWGNPPAFFLGDNQKIKTGIVRGILDNMSLANNGQKFIARGALDYVNFKRMNNGERHIIVNKPDGISDGSYNNLPNSVFSTLQLITRESEDLSGVSSGGPALTQDILAKDGAPTQLTMSQQRMASTVRNLSNMLRKILGKWITMAEVFITDDQIRDMFFENEIQDMNVFSIAKKSKIKITIGTEVNRNQRIAQLNMLAQQAKTLEKNAPPGALNSLVAEMYDLFDMHEKANELRSYEPKPSEAEIAMQQMELMKVQLENQKLQTEIGVMTKDVEARYMNAEARMMEANANYGYKGAQTKEKLAKAQGHQIDSAMKPVQVENEIMKTNTDAMNKTNKGN